MAPPALPGVLLTSNIWALPVWLRDNVRTPHFERNSHLQVVQCLEAIYGRMCLWKDRQREGRYWKTFARVVRQELTQV